MPVRPFNAVMCAVAIAAMLQPLSSTAAPAVWTEHNDNTRTGANLSETVLTPANVNQTQFGKLWTANLDDESYSQPLYLPGVTVGGVARNAIYVTTVNNSVYCFDADSGASLWHVGLTPTGARSPNRTDFSALGACGGNYNDFSGNVGIVGTPVIDTSTTTMYVVSRDLNGSTWTQRLHALDCTTGAEKIAGPVTISGSNAGTNFDAALNNQRPALALVNGTVYIEWSSECDNGAYHGYVIGYNASNLSRVAAWSSTNSGGGMAGIWMGGQGVAADAGNNLYLMTGNGSWDGAGNYGESFAKLAGGSLTIQDYFTPNNYGSLNGGNSDLGSAGCLLIPGTSLVFGGGKQGMVYLLNTASLGHENATDQVVQEFQATFPTAGTTGHIHGSPVYFNNGSSKYVYLWGENDFCRAFLFNGSTFNSTAAATGTMRAPVSNSGMPGGFLSISANGTSNGIIWALTPYNANANNATVAGILHAFNATPSGSTLTELWNSKQNAARDDFGNYAKFTNPTVANGKVYVPTFGSATSGSGTLCAYGLISTEAPYGGTASSIPGTVQAENYDTGGEGVAYHDTDTTNNGGQYRTADGVDIEACTDTGGGYDVGWTQPGEYMKYTVNVATAGTYTVGFRVASGSTGGTFHLANSAGTNLTGTVTVPGTGGWQTWTTVNATVNLPAGQQILTYVQDTGAGSCNINYMTFTSTGPPSTPTGLVASAGNAQVGLSWAASSGATSYNIYRSTTPGGEGTTAIATSGTTSYTNTGLTNGTTYYYKVAAVNSVGTSAQSSELSAKPVASGEAPFGGTPWAVPGVIQIENYDTGGQGVGYSIGTVNGTSNSYRTDGVDIEACTDTGGGYDVGWAATGQWFRYTVNVATAGSHTVTFRVASGASTGGPFKFHVQNAAGTTLGSLSVNYTGGWQTWTTVSTTVTLPAGQQVLTLYQDTANYNVNSMSFN